MRILLDTHIALWAVTGSAQLAPEAVQAILAADEVFVSTASLWEIAIKRSLGRGDMPVSSSQALHAFESAGYSMLDIKPVHVLRVEQLAPIHRDPFDRLLVVQALVEPMTLITRDATVARYSDAIMQVA